MANRQFPSCPLCAYWEKPNRRGERFQLGWGAITFNIDRARKLIDELGLIPQPIETEQLRSFVTWPKPPEVNEAGQQVNHIPRWASINYEHVAHVDRTVPIIIATFELDGTGRHHGPIDGHHRIARALRDGQLEIPAFILDEQRTKKIMRRRRTER